MLLNLTYSTENYIVLYTMCFALKIIFKKEVSLEGPIQIIWN